MSIFSIKRPLYTSRTSSCSPASSSQKEVYHTKKPALDTPVSILIALNVSHLLRSLKLTGLRSPGERQHVSYVAHACYIHDDTLESKAVACMLDATVLA